MPLETFVYLLGASHLDPSMLIPLRALVINHMLQADIRATPCSHLLCALSRPLQQRDSWHRHGHRHS